MITPLGILKFEHGTKINPKPSKVPVNLNLLLVPYSKILDKKGYLYFSQKILKTQLEQIRQKYFMSPQAWEKYYQKNRTIFAKKQTHF